MEAKKNPNLNLEKQVGYRFQIGIVLGLSVALLAFEWSQVEYKKTMDYSFDASEEEEKMANYKIIKKPIPELKKVVKKNAEINVVDELKKVIIIEEPKPNKPEPTDFVVKGRVIDDDGDDSANQEKEVFAIVEEMPSFIGGEEELYRFLAKNIKYPYLAKDADIQGIVYITFVILEDGTISEAQVMRGIGAGCDEEALRVINKMPRWKPGKQRGRPVRVQFNMPIKFKLKKG